MNALVTLEAANKKAKADKAEFEKLEKARIAKAAKESEYSNAEKLYNDLKGEKEALNKEKKAIETWMTENKDDPKKSDDMALKFARKAEIEDLIGTGAKELLDAKTKFDGLFAEKKKIEDANREETIAK